jgi:hypothetical protein
VTSVVRDLDLYVEQAEHLVHDLDGRVHERLRELHEVPQPLLPRLAPDGRAVPRGHLGPLLVEHAEVRPDLCDRPLDHLRRQPCDECVGCSLGDRLLLLRDQRVDARQFGCSGSCVPLSIGAAGREVEHALLVCDEPVHLVPDAVL